MRTEAAPAQANHRTLSVEGGRASALGNGLTRVPKSEERSSPPVCNRTLSARVMNYYGTILFDQKPAVFLTTDGFDSTFNGTKSKVVGLFFWFAF